MDEQLPIKHHRSFSTDITEWTSRTDLSKLTMVKVALSNRHHRAKPIYEYHNYELKKQLSPAVIYKLKTIYVQKLTNFIP
jgi:hypothetical protein